MRFHNESLCELGIVSNQLLENKVKLYGERNSVHVEIFKNKNSDIKKPRYNPKILLLKFIQNLTQLFDYKFSKLSYATNYSLFQFLLRMHCKKKNTTCPLLFSSKFVYRKYYSKKTKLFENRFSISEMIAKLDCIKSKQENKTIKSLSTQFYLAIKLFSLLFGGLRLVQLIVNCTERWATIFSYYKKLKMAFTYLGSAPL